MAMPLGTRQRYAVATRGASVKDTLGSLRAVERWLRTAVDDTRQRYWMTTKCHERPEGRFA
jgi:hypothetical protein